MTGALPVRRLATGAILIAYYLLVSWDTVQAHFAPDEMFAIWWYWHPGMGHFLASQFLVWKSYLRPFGGFFFLPIYWKYGLDSLSRLSAGAGAHQRVSDVSRGARAGLRRFAGRGVGADRCYHGGLSNLYYNSVFVFDVLAGIWFFAAFAYYARIRAAGESRD